LRQLKKWTTFGQEYFQKAIGIAALKNVDHIIELKISCNQHKAMAQKLAKGDIPDVHGEMG
jgi:hypothetical protein